MNLNDEPLFPLLIPTNKQQSEFIGFIQVLGKQYPIEIKLSNGGSNINSEITTTLFIEDLEFNCTKELYDILYPHVQVIKNRFVQCKNIQQFFFELKDIIDRISINTGTSSTTSTTTPINKTITLPFDTFSLISNEIDEIGWNKVVNIDKSLSSFEIMLLDIKEREFIVEFNIPIGYPTQFPFVKCDLPISSTELITKLRSINTSTMESSLFNNNSGGSSLEINNNNSISISNIIKKIQIMIDYEYQEFFNFMEEIDSNSWVLEPLNPRKSSIFRRIAIGNGCSICFEVNPNQPRVAPFKVDFIGPTSKTQSLHQLWNRKYSAQQWFERCSPVDNFQKMLELSFPLKSIDDTLIEEIIIQCSICYAHHLPQPILEQQQKDMNNNNNNNNGDNSIKSMTSLPNVTCNNIKCSKQFHYHCISEWLFSLPTTVIGSSTINGACPYCSSKMTIEKMFNK
ncbi:hypothetical protein RB653_003817 [Dictyostelium firmibasis]|uniref:RING-type domain-containing protein n=1 Tax=Dictyostelium firmibasis TaxID=79012 RepID=A0AAN7TYE6_9MYCE